MRVLETRIHWEELAQEWAARDAVYRARRKPLTDAEANAIRIWREAELVHRLHGPQRQAAFRAIRVWQAPTPARRRRTAKCS